MKTVFRVSSLLFSLIHLLSCAQGVTSSKEDLMFYLMSEFSNPVKTLNLRFYIQDDAADADIGTFTLTSGSQQYTLTIQESELRIDSFNVYPYTPSGAASFSAGSGTYTIKHTDHLSALGKESADPMTGQEHTLRNFHIANSALQTGAAYISDSILLSGSFNGNYIMAKFNVRRFRLSGKIKRISDNAEIPFETNTDETVYYAVSDCRTALSSGMTDSKNIIFKLNDLYKDKAGAPVPDALHQFFQRTQSGGLPVIRPGSNGDLLINFNQNMSGSLREYRCVNGSYI